VVAPVRTASAELAALGVEQHPGGFDAVTPAFVGEVDVIVHAAATAGPDLATARAVNVDGTRRLWEAGRAAGVPRFVHVSTTSVYAPPDEVGAHRRRGGTPGRRRRGREPLRPHQGRCRAAAADRELADRADDPPAARGARGRRDLHVGTRVPTAIRDGRGFPQPRAQTFAFVHVEDLVDAVLAAAALDGGSEGGSGGGHTPHGARMPIVANVVGGHVTVGDYLDAVVDLLPSTVPTRPGTDATGWTGRYATDRLPRELGVAPHRSFRTGMAEIAADWADRDQEVGG
jgi:2-alkyl-3-oxoalkanoate reductase